MDNKTSNKNATVKFLLSVKFRTMFLVVGVAVVFYVVFNFLLTTNHDVNRMISRQFYADELKLLISDKYMALTNPDDVSVANKKYLDERFELLISKGVTFRSVTQNTNSTDLEKHATEQFLLIYDIAKQAQTLDDPDQIYRLYLLASEYPTWDTYTGVLDIVSRSAARTLVQYQILLLTLFTMAILGFVVLHLITLRISQIQQVAHDLTVDETKLDLSQRISFSTPDELGYIANKLNHFFSHLETSVSEANTALRKILYQTDQMFTSSENWFKEIRGMENTVHQISHQMNGQIASVSQASAALEEMERTLDVIFKNISRQSAAMTESAATLEEMGRQVESVASISQDTASFTAKLTEIADKGHQAVDASIVSIRDVSEYSTQIIKLLKLITGIAKQTNLLAMNASIEAAHAGEAGRGFAIVAEEIRRLSETTNKNAKEIQTVVDTMVEKIENSVSQAQIAGTELHQINVYANNVAEKTVQLNNMMQEQNSATHEMITTIEGLTNLAQEIKFSMEEQQQGLHEYSNVIFNLQETFNTTKGQLDNYLGNVANLLSALQDAGIRIRIKKDIADNVLVFLNNFTFGTNIIIDKKAIDYEQEALFLNMKATINSKTSHD